MRGQGWKTVFCAPGLIVTMVAGISMAQEPTPPPSASAAPAPAAIPSKPGKQKYSHANDYLIRGTVFNEKALSFPGVQLRIRLVGEKKFRWESYTDSRGEFAVRVPQGSTYEMVVRVKGFEEQTRTIDAKNGGDADNIVIRMQPAEGGKK
jgi:hypothetical protein